MRKTIALIPGGFKPFTRGHYFLVQQAANEADQVRLLVSTSDRKRTGELPIMWEGQMEEIWQNYLEKAMPRNVEVIYVKNPTHAVLETLGNAEKDEMDANTYVIFGDEKDVPKIYPDKNLAKHFPRLMSNDQIEKKPFSRGENIDISGTKMREYVVNGNIEEFTANLPEPVQRYGQEIFDILKQTIDQIKQPKKKKK